MASYEELSSVPISYKKPPCRSRRSESPKGLREGADVSLNAIDANLTAESDTIALNGGKLKLDTALNGLKINAENGGEIEVGAQQVLIKGDVTETSDADSVILSGQGGLDLQGKEVNGIVEMAPGICLDETTWTGTVYTGSIARGAALDVPRLGHAGSRVLLGSSSMSRAAGNVVLDSLTAGADTIVPGSLSLQSGPSTSGNLSVHGTLTLGTATSAATLNAAGTVILQGLAFGHADSSMQAE